MKEFEGKLIAYTEQGMEGGQLCFQNSEYIKLEAITSNFQIYKGIVVRDKENLNKKGVVSDIEIFKGNSWIKLHKVKSYSENCKIRVSVIWNNTNIESRNINSLIKEKWDFKGLTNLIETDYIIVRDKLSNKIIKEEFVEKIPLKLFSQIKKEHFPNNSEWEKYFDENYPVKIIRK